MTISPRVAALAALAFAVSAACGDDGGNGGGGIDAPVLDAPACTLRDGWNTAADLPLGATQETAAVAVDGKIYVLGGFNGALGVIAAVQIYDTATCTWSTGPELPMAVHHANAAAVGGTIYVAGAMVTLGFTAIGDVWAWNPATDAGWSTRTSMPAGTQRGSAITGVIGTRIVLAGGLRGGAVAEVSAYDTATDTWDTNFPPLPAPRDHGCGGVVGGKLYVTGGRRGDIESQSAAVYELTPGGGWLERAPMPTARGGTACGVVDGTIVVAGGEGNGDDPSGVFPQVEAFDPAANTWTTLAPMPEPRHGLGAAAWGDTIYFPGGASRQAFGAVATHEVLQL